MLTACDITPSSTLAMYHTLGDVIYSDSSLPSFNFYVQYDYESDVLTQVSPQQNPFSALCIVPEVVCWIDANSDLCVGRAHNGRAISRALLNFTNEHLKRHMLCWSMVWVMPVVCELPVNKTRSCLAESLTGLEF